VDFELGLINIKGEKKSLKSLNKKVDQEAIINLFFNDKMLNSISSTLVGLGILGTFSGLAIGVSGFEMESTETIKNSISSLLGGMGTAFVTSIHGMLWSLLFTLSYQFIRHKVLKMMDVFYSSMDKEYLATEVDIEEYHNIQQQDNLKTIIQEYFVNEEEGVELSPKFYFKELLDNSRNQTNLLSTFASEIREQLEHVIEQILEKANENFKEVIETKLLPVLEELRKEKQESASDAIEGIIKRLEIAMKEMIVEFKETISGETKGEMEELARILSSTASSLDTLPSDIEAISSSLKDDIRSVSESVNTVILQMFDEQEKSVQQRREIEQQSNHELSGLLDSISSNVQSLISQQEVNSEKFRLVIEEMNIMTNQNRDNIESFNTMVLDSKEIFKRIESSTDSMAKVSSHLNIGSEALRENSERLKIAVGEFVRENGDTVKIIQTLQKEIQTNTSSFLNQFEKMEGGIQNVFTEFNTGLENYTSGLNNSLSSSIGGFVDKTKDSIEAINSLTTELNDSIEVLAESIKKIN
jgi:methyl-accepting chemotaxis protein